MHRPTPIDLYTPAQATELLRLDDQALIELVNRGLLSAYRLGDGIRFRVDDVASVAENLVAG